MSGASPVTLERKGHIGVIIVDYPPVNALGPGVADGIKDCVTRGNLDPAIKAMVLIGAGRSFIAGADIRGFGTNRARPPLGQRVYDTLDASEKPIVAAIHGYALGGGLEIAMACHYRVALPSARVGLPEVLIGILPGGGGTQRLPRLTGVRPALDMIITGRHVPASEAKQLGIIDAVLPQGSDLHDGAVDFAIGIATSRPLPRMRDRTVKLDDPGIFDAMRKSIARRARNQKAPYHCIEAVEAACKLPFDEGCRREAELFKELENSDEARALRYAFFAEREVARLPDLPANMPVRDFANAAVVGAGTMGGGIAMSFADFGMPVQIMDATPEALARGMQRIRDNYATSVRRGTLAEDEMERRLARIDPVDSYEEIGDCDVVIEAVFEEMDVKKAVFARLDEVMKPGALLFSNTSALNIDQLAAMTRRPEDVAGTHFFSPANVMKLLEVVRGKASSPQTLATVMAMGRRIGKVASIAAIATASSPTARARRSAPRWRSCSRKAPARAGGQGDGGFRLPDGAVRGRRPGRLGYRAREPAAAGGGESELPQKADRRSSGGNGPLRAEDRRRLLSLREGRPHAVSRSRSRRHHQEVGAATGQSGSASSPRSEILRRLLFASVNEACKIMEEGNAYRASDVDVMWLYGFGFPRYRGGLFFWADGIGVSEVYDQIAAWHQQYGNRWAPSRLLRELAESGTPFREAKVAAFVP